MSDVFISYSGNRIERAVLFNALRDHGVTPWRDVDSLEVGDRTTDTIETELAACAHALLWLNTGVLESDYVTSVELPAIARAFRRGLRIIPVFDGLTPADAGDLVSKHGIEIGDSNGYVVEPDARPEDNAIAIARKCVTAQVATAQAVGRPAVVRLVSYDDTADLREEAVINFDWRHRFPAGNPEPQAETLLRDALAFSAAAVKERYGATEIRVAIKAHLPLAVALGHAFAEPTGCRLQMRRGDDLYTTTRDGDDVQELTRGEAPLGPITARAAAIEVSVSRNIEAGVNAYIGLGTRYRHRTMLAPPAGADRTAIFGPAAAQAWARQIAHAVITMNDRAEIDRVDLFLATTVELAIMVGWWLNAGGHINVMNWAGKSGPYERQWSLP